MNEGYVYHVMLLTAYLWPEGQQVQNGPTGYVGRFIETNFGMLTAVDAMEVLKILYSELGMLQANGREDAVNAKLLNAGVGFAGKPYEESMRLLAYYIGLANEIWGNRFDQTCKEKLYTIAELLGLKSDEVDILLDMTMQEEVNPVTAALNVLELPPDATKEDIRTAYRRLSLKYHPDRNLNKSEAERKEAEQKFKEIVAAKQYLDLIQSHIF